MAVAFDAATDGGDKGGANSSKTFSHSCAGSDRCLIVTALGDQTNDLITGVTYNGVAMTLAAKRPPTGDRWLYLFYLLNPASGSNSVVVTASGTTYILTGAASYTGVGLVGNVRGGGASGTSLTL